MNVHTEASRMLRDAREHIERVGWAQGTERASNGAVCLIRALKDVNGHKHGEAAKFEAYRIVYQLIGTTSIPDWNDALGREKLDVLEMLQAAEHIEQELAS